MELPVKERKDVIKWDFLNIESTSKIQHGHRRDTVNTGDEALRVAEVKVPRK